MTNSGWDDVIMCVAIVLVGGISACSVIREHIMARRNIQHPADVDAVAEHGLGKDIWTVPFNSITTLLHVRFSLYLLPEKKLIMTDLL